ncbi:arylsulfotransferase family protein [Solirubrobacter sp. CPCC 204708]|uniref:Arylsulfotransferase family protein n=1 Tax=Solirubrobacter deserti TaxID=2282478 RepID=A0ABT4RR32_9ACTN|nr:arylsulfotransferase family protein [Solirubrobacter deserti]MBE2314716.1 arylsulfotransferase family protein [Solirubrobacter deserti]MDA0141033.1 arylsulfotransferase family protein [Solirubrobacter deserti]
MRKLILALGATAAFTGGTTIVLAQANAQQDTEFSVYPVPGTLTAGEKTTISFRGGNADALGTVTVRGSRSGSHPGKLVAHSDGRGVSFKPDKPFEANEQVTVQTDRKIVGASNGDFEINIGDETTRKARPVELPDVGRGDVQKYETRPDLSPPAVTVTTAKPGRAPGLVFLAPKAGRGQDGPMIINDQGELVWFKATPGKIPADFRVQQLGGKPVLTWWEGQLFVGDGDGVGQVYDQNYQKVATVTAGNGYSFDLHEFTLTPQGTALVLSYERFKRDLRPWGGPKDSRVVDNIVQEIDLKTGAVLFEWHSFGNVGLKESGIPAPTAPGFEWEYFHVNSVELTPDNNFLISARNTSAVYKIDRRTGKVLWTLGGKNSTFKLGKGVRFDWQHSARTQADGTINIYDNSAAPPTRKNSRVINVRLDEQAKTATLVKAFKHPLGLLSASQGNVETLPNGNLFVGWGSQRWFSEFDAKGNLVFDGRIARGNDNYRAFRSPWQGYPSNAPQVTAEAGGGKVTARVSWNGATEVARWELLGGADANSLAPLASAPYSGFETALSANGSPAVVAVRAYDAAGKVLTTSGTTKPE